MHSAIGAALFVCIAALLLLAAASAVAFRLDPARRALRALTRALGAPPEAYALCVQRGQALGLRINEGRIAVVRGTGDRGLIYDLDELVGAELIFDNQVAARIYAGEQRRALDNISPEVSRVILRLSFDDIKDPEFELEFLNPDDALLRHPPDPRIAVEEGRRWFNRLEAVLRRGGRGALRP